jgi:hypothetical protein
MMFRATVNIKLRTPPSPENATGILVAQLAINPGSLVSTENRNAANFGQRSLGPARWEVRLGSNGGGLRGLEWQCMDHRRRIRKMDRKEGDRMNARELL